MKRIVLITFCAVILPASLTRSEQRTITVTGFAIREYPADWVHFTMTSKLEGKPGKQLSAALAARTDSIKAWLGSLGPGACSLSISRPGRWVDWPTDGSRPRRERKGLSCCLDVWLYGAGKFTQVANKYSSADYALQLMERGLAADSAAIREVSSLAIKDAREQAVVGAEAVGATLADVLTVELNPISDTERALQSGSLADFWGRESFYSRGQIPAANGRWRSPIVVRRAVAIVRYAVQ